MFSHSLQTRCPRCSCPRCYWCPYKIVYFRVSATPIVSNIPYVNSHPLVLNVSFNIAFLKVIFFSINYALLYNIYLPYDLILNESGFITISKFSLLAMVNILIISRAEWEIAGWIDKWTIAVSVIEQILQHLMDSIAG